VRVTGIAGAAAGVWIAGRCKASVGKAGGIRSDDVTTTVVVGATVVAGEAFDADENVSNAAVTMVVAATGISLERLI
jgi:hypothetical protein